MRIPSVLAVAALVAGCSASSSSSLSNSSSTPTSNPSRTLTAFTSTTGTTVDSYFMSPNSNGTIGSYACNGDYPTDGYHCTEAERQCAQVTETTSSCQSTRTALGLSGLWLDFSCNVIEGLAYKSGSSYVSTTTYSDATYVSLTTYDFPTYSSYWYPQTGSYDFTANGYTISGLFDSLYTSSYDPPFPDPGSIGSPTETITMYVPLSPAQCTGGTCTNGTTSASNYMAPGPVGMAINGVYIYGNFAAGTDNIFAEDGSFDDCDGHPAGSQYHYHGEPYAISHNDSNLIGVMMDGYWVYGRDDGSAYASDYTNSAIATAEPGSQYNVLTYGDNNGDSKTGSSSTMYIYGGHVGVPPTGGSSVFHYHLTEWVGCYDETTATSSGYYFTDNGVTFDTYNSSNFTNGSTGTPAAPGSTAGSGGNQYCEGTWVDAWFLTGHGNGGVFQDASSIGTSGTGSLSAPVWTDETSPTGSTGAPTTCGGISESGGCPSQSTNAIRYYYGVPGSCPNCNSDNT